MTKMVGSCARDVRRRTSDRIDGGGEMILLPVVGERGHYLYRGMVLYYELTVQYPSTTEGPQARCPPKKRKKMATNNSHRIKN